MTTFYISGPMRGKPDYNREQFRDVQDALCDKYLEADAVVINPARNFDGDVSRDPTEYLNLDLQQVMSADVIVLLPGWRESEGARREVELGVWTGKRFMEATAVPYGPSDDTSPEAWRSDRWLWQFTDVDISSPSKSPSVRADALDEAKSLITGDRNNAYGPPWQDFSRTAGALTAMGYRGPDGRELESHDIAIFVMEVKISRLMWTPTKRDSWVDVAGYAGCGLECALHDEEVKKSA